MAWTDPSSAPFLAGHEPTSAELVTHITNNFKAIGDAWTSYTPVWTSSGTAPALGNGTLTGVYRQAGKLTIFRLTLTMGSTTTYGTGEYRLTYPVAALGANNPGLNGFVFRSGPLYWGVLGVGFGTSSFRMIGFGNALVTATSPTTFANGDQLHIGGTYEAA